MKKIFLLIISFIATSTVMAFNIDIDKIDVNSRGKGLARTLDSAYKIETGDFENLIVSDGNAVKLVKKIINITISNKDIDSKKKEYTEYMFLDKTDGAKTLAGTLFRDSYFEELKKYRISGGYISDVKTVPFNDDVLAFAYIKDAKVNDVDNEIVLTYWLKKDNNEFKVYFPWVTVSSKLEDYFEKLTKEEDAGDIVGESYNKMSFDSEEDSSVSNEELKMLFQKNNESIVQISGMKDNGINMYGSGFFIKEGVVVTTWSLIQEFLTDCNYIFVNDVEGNTYHVSGVVALQTDYDVVVLKLDKEVGKKVSFIESKNVKLDDKLFLINSRNNSGFSINYGSFISLANGRLKNLLAISSSDVGSALFTKDSEVVGFVVADQLNSELSFANSTDYLMDLQRILSNKKFDEIKTTSLDDFKNDYYLSFRKEKEINNIPSKVWNKLNKIGKLEDTIQLDLIKGTYENRIMSLRYVASNTQMLDSIYLVASYIEELENEGFKLVQDENDKKVFDSKDYKVIIKNNFNYIIIIIMEK